MPDSDSGRQPRPSRASLKIAKWQNGRQNSGAKQQTTLIKQHKQQHKQQRSCLGVWFGGCAHPLTIYY